MNPYLGGDRLYGDDLPLPEIQKWHEDEREAYADLLTLAGETEAHCYPYHELNRRHGYSALPERPLKHVLGMGSAHGDEFEPIKGRIESLTIVEPGDSFHRREVCGIPARYVAPQIDGGLPFEDNAFDLITCFGVLHHIPNVTHVVSELYRCLASGGYALVREPIVSMGDWTKPRKGLTKHERGIPAPIFDRIVRDAGFSVRARRFCVFPPFLKTWNAVCRTPVFNCRWATIIDAALSRMFAFNVVYHSSNFVGKFRPVSVFYVLSKP
jgi:SAM-dependent methyltransferase